MGDAAEVVHHPGCSGIHDVGDAREPTKSSQVHDCAHDARASLWAMLVRGRGFSPLALVLALILGGGGAGIGGSWLLGPGGWSDDAAMRADVAAMRSDIGSMRASLESCEENIELLDDGQVELYEAVYDQQDKHAAAIKTIAAAAGVIVDVSPPRQRARRVRR